MSVFSDKNRRRAEGRKNGDGQQRANARQLRRKDGGAFGNLAAAGWNERVYGTTGSRR